MPLNAFKNIIKSQKLIIEDHLAESHNMGLVFYNPEINFAHIPIPKCASSWVNFYLSHLKYRVDGKIEFVNDTIPDVKYTVVLRDPVDRWTTGISEYLSRNHPVYNLSDDLIEFACNIISFDAHTVPQVNFLDGLNIKQLIFFKLDNSFVYNFSSFYNYKLPKTMVKLWKNESREKFYRHTIKEKVTDFLKNNPEYVSKLKKYFTDDYKLINKVKFNGT